MYIDWFRDIKANVHLYSIATPYPFYLIPLFTIKIVLFFNPSSENIFISKFLPNVFATFPKEAIMS